MDNTFEDISNIIERSKTTYLLNKLKEKDIIISMDTSKKDNLGKYIIK